MTLFLTHLKRLLSGASMFALILFNERQNSQCSPQVLKVLNVGFVPCSQIS